MTHLSLFSGIGGLDLAAEWAGFETVAQCEMADYPTKILEKHWPDLPRWRDIRTLTKEDFFARTGLRTVDIISGGFPCQPFSVAGKQKGREDDRYLWPEMRRVIAELEPRWVVGENVPGILRIAAKDVIADLESLGYHVLLLDFEAAAVGAFHRRERIAFVANRDNHGQPAAQERGSVAEGGSGSANGQKEACKSEGLRAAREYEALADCDGMREQPASGGRPESRDRPCNGSTHVPDTRCRELRHDGNHGRAPDREKYEAANTSDAGGKETIVPNHKSKRLQRFRTCRFKISRTRFETRKPERVHHVRNATGKGLQAWAKGAMGKSKQEPKSERPIRWPAEPDVGRVAHGVPNRVDRIKGLGNAVCPPQFYPIFRAIYEWENGTAIRF